MLSQLKTYAAFVRFSHSVFALPFALVGAILASRQVAVTAGRVGWIVVAMVAARSAAMAFNRLADARWDALNPRTAMRELPSGALTSTQGIVFLVGSSLVFLGASWQLGWLCFALAPLALAIVFWYSLAKRFTYYTQIFLGVAMAVAPIGGWLAAGGGLSWTPILLGVAIGSWVGGFDILYACQDLDFDRSQGLRSIPVRYGVPGALRVSRTWHVITVVCLASLGWLAGLGPIYHAGVVGVALLLVYEQSLVSVNDLSRVRFAFDLNGYVGILYLVTTGLAVYLN